MANRSNARHRAACRPSTPLTPVVQAIASPQTRMKMLAVAGSGLAIGAVAAHGAVQPAAVSDLAHAATVPAAVNRAVTAPQVSFAVPQAAVSVVKEAPKPAASPVAKHQRATVQAQPADEEQAPAVDAPAPKSGIVAIAMRYLGRPYVWGATGPNAFDCSGLVRYVYAQVGISLPHQSGAIAAAGTRIPVSQARPGDVLWHSGHVAIYIGNGQIIHANHPGGGVVITQAKYLHFTTAVRF